ncbi:hypothetical protein [Myxosarcina sp. GI1]|uniref:hypothetical protein n=1 Tax=Myxosarcina sp. GI1 TaxID=1541065 RepID=UPI0012DFEADF|nr:hypothetical protein [Myxosarcina sp. GI1]
MQLFLEVDTLLFNRNLAIILLLTKLSDERANCCDRGFYIQIGQYKGIRIIAIALSDNLLYF